MATIFFFFLAVLIKGSGNLQQKGNNEHVQMQTDECARCPFVSLLVNYLFPVLLHLIVSPKGCSGWVSSL